MSDEIKKLIEEGNKSFHNFKEHVEREIKEVKEKGAADPLTKAAMDKLTGSLTDAMQQIQDMKAQQKALETAFNRPSAGKDGAENAEQKAADTAHKNAFAKYMRKGNEAALSQVEAEHKDLVTISDPDGGYLVRPEISDRVIKRVFESTPMRQVANVITIASKSVEMLLDDDEAESGGWTGETGTVSDTDTPQVGKITIEAKEQYAQPRATQTLLDDAGIDVEAWLSGKITDIFIRTENTAFISGNSPAKPRGILTYDNWASAGVYERNKVEQIALGAAAEVTADGLISLQNSLIEAYQANAVWMFRRASMGAIAKLKDGQGNYLFNRMLDKNTGTPFDLLGKPVLFAADMPAIGAGTLAVAYADFGQAYQIVDRKGITVLRDPFTAKPYVKFYTTKRTGGEVVNFQAIKIGKVAASL